jgi:hypothetical protein
LHGLSVKLIRKSAFARNSDIRACKSLPAQRTADFLSAAQLMVSANGFAASASVGAGPFLLWAQSGNLTH